MGCGSTPHIVGQRYEYLAELKMFDVSDAPHAQRVCSSVPGGAAIRAAAFLLARCAAIRGRVNRTTVEYVLSPHPRWTVTRPVHERPTRTQTHFAW